MRALIVSFLLAAIFINKAAVAADNIDAVSLYKIYASNRAEVLREEECYRNRTCANDRVSVVMSAAEAAFSAQQQIETLAAKGDAMASYLAGVIRFDRLQRLDYIAKTYSAMADIGYGYAARQAKERLRFEANKSATYLKTAVDAKMPEACLVKGQVFEVAGAKNQSATAAEYYFCAIDLGLAQGKADLAKAALAGIQRVVPAQHPLLAKANARMFMNTVSTQPSEPTSAKKNSSPR